MLYIFAALLLLFSLTSAEFTFNTSWTYPIEHDYAGDTLSYSIPSSLVSERCSRTYAQRLPCSEDLIWLVESYTDITVQLGPKALELGCGGACYSALFQWGEDIRNDCTEEDMEEVVEAVDKSTPWSDIHGRNFLGRVWREDSWLEKWWFASCIRKLNLNPRKRDDTTTEDESNTSEWQTGGEGGRGINGSLVNTTIEVTGDNSAAGSKAPLVGVMVAAFVVVVAGLAL